MILRYIKFVNDNSVSYLAIDTHKKAIITDKAEIAIESIKGAGLGDKNTFEMLDHKDKRTAIITPDGKKIIQDINLILKEEGQHSLPPGDTARA